MKQELRVNGIIASSGSAVMEAKLTPEYIAKLFWNMDANEQANFFCWLGDNAASDMPFQLQAVTDSNQLTDNARRIMEMIGDYSEKG